jgi:hypothetical protein
MRHFFLALGLLVALPAYAQTTPAAPAASGRPATVQPRIMVIPRVKEGQDLRTVLDGDLELRIGITKVKEAFDRRGFSTVDFVARLKAANENGLFTSGSQSDVKEQIIQFSGADIFVELELSSTPSPQGNSSTAILSAFEVSTGTSLANKIGNSGRFYGASNEQLIQRAVEVSADDLLSTMQAKFTDMLEQGRSILVDISVRNGVRLTFENPPKGKDQSLAELIEEWMQDNAFNNSAHLQGSTGIRMLFDDVRIPLRDTKTGRSYGANQFGTALASFLRSLGLTVTRDVKGSTLLITVTGA